MKKLLAILAISTITIVPSITLVSCFNDTKPKYFTFDENNPIESIRAATYRKHFTLSYSDFNSEKKLEEEVAIPPIAETMIFQISNSFTLRKDANAAKEWLNSLVKSEPDVETTNPFPTEIPAAGEVTILTLSAGDEESTKSVNVQFFVEEGNSFYWLHNKRTKSIEKDEEKDFFLGAEGKDFATNNPLSIKSYLIESWIAVEKETSPESALLKANIATNIYNQILLQATNLIKEKSPDAWIPFKSLNSSTVVVGDPSSKEEMKYFSKDNTRSISDFLLMLSDSANINGFVEDVIGKLQEPKINENKPLLVKTNFFEFKTYTDEKEGENDGWFTFNIAGTF